MCWNSNILWNKKEKVNFSFIVIKFRICRGDIKVRTYENKEELKSEVKRTYEKYIAEFESIPEELKDKK